MGNSTFFRPFRNRDTNLLKDGLEKKLSGIDLESFTETFSRLLDVGLENLTYFNKLSSYNPEIPSEYSKLVSEHARFCNQFVLIQNVFIAFKDENLDLNEQISQNYDLFTFPSYSVLTSKRFLNDAQKNEIFDLAKKLSS